MDGFLGIPSAEKLRVKAGKAAGLCDGQGIGTFCMQGNEAIGSPGKKIPARSFPGFVGERPVRQRSLSDDLIFWLLLYQDKSNSPRGN